MMNDALNLVRAHVIDALDTFGENVVVEEVERSLRDACRRGHAEVIGFTVAPRYPSSSEPQGRHEWLIEFAEPPRAPDTFVRALDEALQRCNARYRARRATGLGSPRVLELPAGTFHRWAWARRVTGDPRPLPRLANDRVIADAVLASVYASPNVYTAVILL